MSRPHGDSTEPWRLAPAGQLAPRLVYAGAALLLAISFALYASRFGPRDRWRAGDYDPADYRFVAEYFWHAPVAPMTYHSLWTEGWGTYLKEVPFRGIGLGTLYLAAAWVRLGHVPTTTDDVNTAGFALAGLEKLALAAALMTVFAVVRRRWGTAAAFATLAVTAFPPNYWRMCDDFIAEPVERILFLLAFACAVAMTERAWVWPAAMASAGLFLMAAHVKVQWYVAAFALLPVALVQCRALGVSLRRCVALCALTLSIPLTILAVNWMGWRDASLNPGIALHVNLKYDGAVLQAFTASPSWTTLRPAFIDPTRPRLRWWNIYVGTDVSREEWATFDRFAAHWVRTHPRRAWQAFTEGVGLASTVPGVQRMENGNIRLRPIEEPWSAVVRVFDIATWVLLVAGLWFTETRMTSALGLVLWIVPALGNVFSLYEIRYHVPMAGLGAVAAMTVAIRVLGAYRAERLLVPSAAVQ